MNIVIENGYELYIDLNVWGSNLKVLNLNRILTPIITYKISIEMMLRLRNKKNIVMSMMKSIAMGEWTSLKFFYKFKNAPEPNAVRGIFLSVFNESNSKVCYLISK